MKSTTTSSSELINDLFDREDWHAAIKTIRADLRRLPPDDWMRHWWLTRLATAYYELRDYTRARKLSKSAHQIAPDCPLVLWDLAGACEAMGDREEAISTYSRLLRLGARKIAHDECGEGVTWAKGLVADVHYRLGLLYRDVGKYGNAVIELSDYIRLRNPNSIYSASRAKAAIRAIVKQVDRGSLRNGRDRTVGPAA